MSLRHKEEDIALLRLTQGLEPFSPHAQCGTLPVKLTSTYIRYQERIRTLDSCSKNRRVYRYTTRQSICEGNTIPFGPLSVFFETDLAKQKEPIAFQQPAFLLLHIQLLSSNRIKKFPVVKHTCTPLHTNKQIPWNTRKIRHFPMQAYLCIMQNSYMKSAYFMHCSIVFFIRFDFHFFT